MGTATGTNRSLSNPMRKPWCPTPPEGFHPHIAVLPVRSAVERTPHKCASLGLHSHRPTSTGGPARESPCATVSRVAPTGRPRYRASFRGRSAVRMPGPCIARCKEMSAPSGRHDNARRSVRMCSKAGNPSAVRTASFRRSWAGPPRKRLGETAANFKPTPPKIAEKPL